MWVERAMAQLAIALLLAMAMPPNAMAIGGGESEVLWQVREALDPSGDVLSSWERGGDPCGGTFVGVACDSHGKVTNVSLQGRGLTGTVPAVIAELRYLTGLYLHYNSLTGSIPEAISSLVGLTDVYLNVNNLTGEIPSQLGSLASLQALQLCCNQLSGTIPDSLGQLEFLKLLSVQHNRLHGSIPPSLGQLSLLTHLDLSFNELSGSVPAALDNLPQLTLLDVRDNQLSGSLPSGLRTLEQGFFYSNNTGLCGRGFTEIPSCGSTVGDASLERPEPLGSSLRPAAAVVPGIVVQPQTEGSPSFPFPAPPQVTAAAAPSKRVPQVAIISVVLAIAAGLLLAVAFSFIWFRRHKQKISSAHESIDKFSNEESSRDKSSISVFGTPALDGKAAGTMQSALQSISTPKSLIGSSMRSFRFRLDELEMATNYFSDRCLLARKGYMSIYRAVLRDGSTAVVKDITKPRFGDDEQIETAIASLVQLRHDNLVTLRGFCCLKGGVQCYLVYDYVPNGTLFEHLHGGTASRLDWSTRVQIAYGVAKGLEYLHRNGEQLIVWASNVLLDGGFNARISGSGLLTRVLEDEVVYASIKASAVLGYLAPEYGVVGQLNGASDVYAYGVLLLELISGRKPLQLVAMARAMLLENCREDQTQEKLLGFVDPMLEGRFTGCAVVAMANIALACTNAAVEQRPLMIQVVREMEALGMSTTTSNDADAAGFSSSGEEYPTRQQAAYVEMLDYGR